MKSQHSLLPLPQHHPSHSTISFLATVLLLKSQHDLLPSHSTISFQVTARSPSKSQHDLLPSHSTSCFQATSPLQVSPLPTLPAQAPHCIDRCHHSNFSRSSLPARNKRTRQILLLPVTSCRRRMHQRCRFLVQALNAPLPPLLIRTGTMIARDGDIHRHDGYSTPQTRLSKRGCISYEYNTRVS